MELQTKQPPELEFSMPEVEESLTAYLSAIGGAVIGLLLTLLVLAIWNGGTLNFTNTSKVNALEAGITGVATDLEAVNTSVNALGERLVVLEQGAGAVAALQGSLATLDISLADLDQSLSDQGIHLSELDTAVADLQVTRRNFDLFTAALTEALAQMEAASKAAPQSDEVSTARPTDRESARPGESTAQGGEAAPAAVSATLADESQGTVQDNSSTSSNGSTVQAEEQALLLPDVPAPAIVASEEVAPDALLVYLYVDVNADGVFDSDENFIAGATVTLTAPSGQAMMGADTVDSAGTLFGALTAGDYIVAVEDVHGYTLTSESSVSVNVDLEAEAGQIIYFAVVTSLAD